MQIKNIAALLAAGVAGALLVRYFTQAAPTASEAKSVSPVAPIVEDVLHKHQGEDTPMVHAFEATLEEERRQEEQLAHDVGVRA